MNKDIRCVVSNILGIVFASCGVVFGLVYTDNLRAQESVDSITTTMGQNQEVIGWGASMVSWLGEGSVYEDSRWRAAFLDLGFNILRVSMKKEVLIADDGNYSTPVELTDDLDANVARMDFHRSDVRVFGETAQWLLDQDLGDANALVVGSIWSPPHWMKGPTGLSQNWLERSGSHPTPWLSGDHIRGLTPGRGDSIGGRLRTEDPDILASYAQYVAAWVVGFERAYGVPLHAISIQNESTFENPFESMVFNIGPDGDNDFSQYAIALAAVRDAWQAHGLTTKIKGPHVAQIGPTPDNPWSLFQQMSYIDAVRDYDDPTLLDFIAYFNSNYYMSADEAGAMATAGYYLGRAAVDAPWANWLNASGIERYRKPVWISESGGDQPVWINGDRGTAGNGALALAAKIYNALVFANASTFLYWQLSDGGQLESEHTLLGSQNLDHPDDSAKYAAFKHFSAFVRPGAVRLETFFTDTEKSSRYGRSEYDTLHGLSVASFYHEELRTLTYLLLNLTPQQHRVDIGLPDGLKLASYEIITSVSGSHLQVQSMDTDRSESIMASIPSFGLVTIAAKLAQ